MYTDFSFPSLAPRVDLTTSAESQPGQPAEAGHDTRVPDGPTGDIEDVIASADLEGAPSPAEMDSLIARLQRNLERRRRMDRERRGL